MKLHNIP
ncbi:uncharacterized protein FFNC_15726 [Fusarium fujikuroi]|nr:uncharacterized protein FFNC_15726 [Fusarium fujikuroi]